MSSLGGLVGSSVHEFIWNLAEVSEEATAKMCELARRGALPSYLLAKSIMQGNFRLFSSLELLFFRFSQVFFYRLIGKF